MADIPAEAKEDQQPSAWAPFAHGAFAILWTATVISNVGTWMNDVASGWLMTSLSGSPMMVALVQTATTAPVFLFALAAGALADLVDRRLLLISVSVIMAAFTFALGLLVLLEWINPWTLIIFTFILGIGTALIAPAWQAIVPQLVPRPELQPAVALNSVGINVSRAIGPALAGLIIASVGVAWPYFFNTLSFLIVAAALLWWTPPPRRETHLPAERFFGAMRDGWRYTRASAPLRATLVRAVMFFVFASAYWALLPLIARDVLQGGPELYGAILAAIGIGAVAGAAFLPRLKGWLGADKLVAAGTLGTAVVLLAFAFGQRPDLAIGAGLIAGASWIAVLASLNVSAQTSLPDWVRARGLSMFITVFFGAMSIGSLIWGQVATSFGVQLALCIAAVGAVLGIGLSWTNKLNQGAALDLAPSLHWPAPITTGDVEFDRGPVMVTVEYKIDPSDAVAFAALMEELRSERRGNGAYAWGLFENVAQSGHYLEYFIEESWLAHLRHHERVSRATRTLQEKIERLHKGDAPPLVTHLIAPDPDATPPKPLPADGELQ